MKLADFYYYSGLVIFLGVCASVLVLGWLSMPWKAALAVFSAVAVVIGLLFLGLYLMALGS